MLVMVEAGRAVVPLPLTTTLLASRALTKMPWLTPPGPPQGALVLRIVSGDAILTLALDGYPGTLSRKGAMAAPTAVRDSSNWRVEGTHPFVPFGPLAGAVLVEANAEGSAVLFLLPTDIPGASWRDLDLIDRTVPHNQVKFDRVSVPEYACLTRGEGASEIIEQLLAEWTVALAAETLGACERMLEMSVAYAKERVQFGRPIGANQAVKIRLADMGAAVERMRAAVYHAAVKIDADAEDRGLAVAMAKVATSGQGAWLGSQAIHVHGGIGYTWEHDLHLYFKRIKSNELLLGDDSLHLARVGDAVL